MNFRVPKSIYRYRIEIKKSFNRAHNLPTRSIRYSVGQVSMSLMKTRPQWVTVVTVTRNASSSLEETILSVLNQSYEFIEYIIIDGASSDSTIALIEKFQDHLAYWVSESDSGIYHAMNKAISRATGEWIIFINAGDKFFNSSTLSDIFSESRENHDVIYGDTLVKSENGASEIEKAEDLEGVMWKYNPFYHQSMLVRTELMKRENFDTGYPIAADAKFVYSQLLQGKRFLRLDFPISVYLEGGVSMVNDQDAWKERLALVLEFGERPREEILAHYRKFIRDKVT